MPKKIISTVFYTGKVKFAPGTFGTCVAFLISTLYRNSPHFFLISVLLTLITFILGLIYADKYAKSIAKEDPSEIVIDEYCGYFLSCAISYYFVTSINVYFLFANFIFFRLSDILKPWPIYIIDRKIKNSLGIMLDDVLAGIYSGIAVIATHHYCSFLF